MNRSRVQLWVPQLAPTVANLYMEYFEQKDLSTAPTQGFGRGMWMTHLPSRRKSTSRTSYNTLTVLTLPSCLPMETNKEDVGNSLLVKPEADENLSITVYRKPTHRDQYLQWDSHHHLSAKFSAINTLTHRPKQCVAILTFTKKWINSGRHLPNVNTLNGLWTGGEKV